MSCRGRQGLRSGPKNRRRCEMLRRHYRAGGATRRTTLALECNDVRKSLANKYKSISRPSTSVNSPALALADNSLIRRLSNSENPSVIKNFAASGDI